MGNTQVNKQEQQAKIDEASSIESFVVPSQGISLNSSSILIIKKGELQSVEKFTSDEKTTSSVSTYPKLMRMSPGRANLLSEQDKSQLSYSFAKGDSGVVNSVSFREQSEQMNEFENQQPYKDSFISNPFEPKTVTGINTNFKLKHKQKGSTQKDARPMSKQKGSSFRNILQRSSTSYLGDSLILKQKEEEEQSNNNL